jgi:hypothetical protein
MASGFRETNRALSHLLTEQARAIGVFDHPTAKGDGREDLLRKFLADRVGTTFGVTKAEVVDCQGNSSGELDIVIFDQRVASCLSVLGERRVVRAEAVVMTIEVKSKFAPSTWHKEYLRVRNGIGRLTRFYRAAPLLTAMGGFMEEQAWAATETMFKTGLSTLDDNEDVPAVVSAFFGYKGPPANSKAVKAFSQTPLLDVVCVLGQYTIAKKRVGFNKRANGTDDARGYVWGRDDDALGAFLEVVEGVLARALDARTLFQPAAVYYRPPKGALEVDP